MVVVVVVAVDDVDVDVVAVAVIARDLGKTAVVAVDQVARMAAASTQQRHRPWSQAKTSAMGRQLRKP